MIERAMGRAFGRFKTGGWLRSSVTWIVLFTIILVGAGIAVHEKGKGQLTKLKTQLGAQPATPDVRSLQPGGQDPIILTRGQQMGAIMPEFLSATLLPGRGMDVLQIKAYIPGKGEVSLLASPSLAEAAETMTGIDNDVNGEATLTAGGAFEVPWAGRLSGAVLPGGLSILANWQGRGLTLPITPNPEGGQTANGGLLLKRGADSSMPSVIPGGGLVQASFESGNFDGHWISKTNVTTTVLLTSRTMDLTVVAKNTGTEPEPMGIGWRPHFAIPSANRSQVNLRIPSTERLEQGTGNTPLPTGKVLPVGGTPYDFSARNGSPLGSIDLNASYVHLKGGVLSSGPEAEIRDPEAGYGLRLTALSPSIKVLHVHAPTGKPMISIDPQTNYDDPLGRVWNKNEDAGIVILQPGESLQWKVRLELFQLNGKE